MDPKKKANQSMEQCYLVMAPEKRLLAWGSKSLCVVNNQPVGNPKRKV
jgi:hypothetical protein